MSCAALWRPRRDVELVLAPTGEQRVVFGMIKDVHRDLEQQPSAPYLRDHISKIASRPRKTLHRLQSFQAFALESKGSRTLCRLPCL
jgi:hypothetical protein